MNDSDVKNVEAVGATTDGRSTGFAALRPHIRRLSGEMLWIITGQFATATASILGVKILTKELSPENYGKLELGLTIPLFANQIFFGPLGGAVLRFFTAAQEGGRLHSYLTATWRLLRQIVGILVVISVGLLLWLHLSGRGDWLLLMGASVPLALLVGCNGLIDSMQSAIRQRAIVAWHQGVGQWLRIGCAVALIRLVYSSGSLALLGYMIAVMIVLGSQSIFFRRTISANADPAETGAEAEWREKLLVYAWPFALWGIFTWIQMSSDRWSLEKFCATSDVGYYGVLYRLGYAPILLGAGILEQLLAPVLFGRAGDGSDSSRVEKAERINRWAVNFVLLLTVIGVLITHFAHTLLFTWLVDRKFWSVSPMLPGMVMAGGLFAAGQSAALILLTRNQSRTLLTPKIVTALCGVAFNAAGAYWLGVTGVICGVIATSGLYFFWVLLLVSSKRRDDAANIVMSDATNPL